MSSFTRERIKKSCLKLLNERPLNQITVKAIVEDCGVNRNSFYYHFADIPTLLNEIVTEYADSLIAEYAHADSLEECLLAATRCALENKRAVLHVYHCADRSVYEQKFIQVCHDVVASYLSAAFGELPLVSEDLIRFFQCELIGQILLWLEDEMRYDLPAQFSRMSKLRRSMVDSAIQRYRESNGAEK